MRAGSGTYGGCTYGATGGTYGDLCPPIAVSRRPAPEFRRLDDDDLVAVALSLLI